MATKEQKEKAKKAVAARNRQIARDNAAFEKMTPSEKRVAIARDVIAQLAAERLVAVPGIWLDFNVTDNEPDQDPELQTILKSTDQCEGCALGGMFMCAVERANKLKLSELDEPDTGTASQSDVFSYMRKFFSREQLNLIEVCFEQGNGAGNVGSDAHDQAMVFFGEAEYEGDCSASANDRMRLIMENIVANNGKFVVTKKPVMTWTTPGYKG
jgi:hypothetical protein